MFVNAKSVFLGTTLIGRIERLLKGDIPCIREDTNSGKVVLWAMNNSLPGTTRVGRGLRVIKSRLELQDRIDKGEEI